MMDFETRARTINIGECQCDFIKGGPKFTCSDHRAIAALLCAVERETVERCAEIASRWTSFPDLAAIRAAFDCEPAEQPAPDVFSQEDAP